MKLVWSLWESHMNIPLRIVQQLRSLGFDSLQEHLAAMSGQPYRNVAARFDDFVFIQMIGMQFEEARRNSAIREAAMDCLCRNIAEAFPDGWNTGDNPEWGVVSALSSWMSEVQVTGRCPELRPRLLAVATALRGIGPNVGWLPENNEDGVLREAFNQGWPMSD